MKSSVLQKGNAIKDYNPHAKSRCRLFL